MPFSRLSGLSVGARTSNIPSTSAPSLQAKRKYTSTYKQWRNNGTNISRRNPQRYSKWPKMLRYCNKSAQNLGRMFLSFRSRTCPYFQWLNASWYKAILDFTLEKLNTPQHHPRYPGLALNQAWWLTNQRKKQNAAPFRDHPYTQSGRSFENKHQAPSAFQRACYTA